MPLGLLRGCMDPQAIEAEARKNERPEAEITKLHNLTVTADSYRGHLSVEYKPEGLILDYTDIKALTEAYSAEAESPEEFVVDLYVALSDRLYPGHSAYDKPWEHVPLVLTLEYSEVAPHTEFESTTTLGVYR